MSLKMENLVFNIMKKVVKMLLHITTKLKKKV